MCVTFNYMHALESKYSNSTVSSTVRIYDPVVIVKTNIVCSAVQYNHSTRIREIKAQYKHEMEGDFEQLHQFFRLRYKKCQGV